MLRKHEIRPLYNQGTEVVAATIRRLYEMIEVEDARVHNLVAVATAGHLQKIEQQSTCLVRLEENCRTMCGGFINSSARSKSRTNSSRRRGNRRGWPGVAPRAPAEELAEFKPAACRVTDCSHTRSRFVERILVLRPRDFEGFECSREIARSRGNTLMHGILTPHL